MGIELDHILLRLGQFQLTADLQFASATTTALIGASGSGKSTILAAIAGFIELQSGSIRLDGKDMQNVPPGQRPVTMLFQDYNLFPHLSVAQNVGLGLKPSLRLNKDELGLVKDALARVDLAGLGNRLPAQLSGGQAGRVALARALLRKRPVLLLDEPFAALGPAQRSEMLDLVSQVQVEKSLTVLLVTHLPEDAARIASFASVVANGTVTKPVATAQLFADPPPALRDYLG